MAKLSVTDVPVKGKRVLVRVDFNVPLDENLNISDESRILGALPTIKYLVENGAKTITGLGMLVQQAALNFTLWTGVEAPVDVMEDALKKEFE